MINKAIIRGFVSYIPGVLKALKKGKKAKGTGGTDSSRYCYSVWLRHLINLERSGMSKMPETIAEIGPGDSLGIGLCALISGVENYYAFDIIEHTNIKKNLEIFEQIVDLFKTRADIPNELEFPFIHPPLSDYSFPDHILTSHKLGILLSDDRIHSIKASIHNMYNKDSKIHYIVPWVTENSELKEKIDLIYSQAVMEHIMDIESAYKACYAYLKPTGFMSHEIDYSAHETHKIWNGHWGYKNQLWKILMHGRAYYINRLPHSAHVALIEKAGFKIITEIKNISNSGISKEMVCNSLPLFYSDDFNVKSAFIQAQK